MGYYQPLISVINDDFKNNSCYYIWESHTYQTYFKGKCLQVLEIHYKKKKKLIKNLLEKVPWDNPNEEIRVHYSFKQTTKVVSLKTMIEKFNGKKFGQEEKSTTRIFPS